MKNFMFYSDCGHGWLRVLIKDIVGLNIQDKISTDSYINGKYAYLEEDCDMTIFLNAYGRHNATIKDAKQCEHRSKIRDFDHYSINKV